MALPDQTPSTPSGDPSGSSLPTVIAVHQSLLALRQAGLSWRRIADTVNESLATAGCPPMSTHAVRQLVEGSRRIGPRGRADAADMAERARLERLGQQRVCE